MSGPLAQVFDQVMAQPLPGSCQARHDRARGQVGDRGNFLVRQSFQLAQHQYFAGFYRQFIQALPQSFAVLLQQKKLGRVKTVALVAVEFLIE
jgi:hypothetical protein